MDRIELQQLFSVAISREVEAHAFYLKVAQLVKDANARAVFQELADAEMDHRELLERLQGDSTMIMKFDASTPSVDFKVAEATDLPRLSTEMKPADAIALAIKKEQQALEFYREMAGQTSDPECKRIFGGLAQMELSHKVKIESVFVEIGFPEVF